MPMPALVLFDDDIARRWEPFVLTRPVGELLFGAFTFRERAERVFGADCKLHISSEHLQDFDEEGAPPVGAPDQLPTDTDRVFLLSRAVPDWSATATIAQLERPAPLAIAGSIAGWFAPAGSPSPDDRFFRALKLPHDSGSPVDLPGRVLENVWEMIAGCAEQITGDALAAGPRRVQDPPAGVLTWGEHPVLIEDDVHLEPGCAIDTSEGPVWLARGARVHAFTRLAGPAYIGPQSRLLGGPIAAVSLGPVCRVRGEMSDTVCLGYTNKQHDGHIGHAYLGRWVNIGAGTNNSDLKNNYGTVRLWTPTGERDTGMIKMGSLIGDHVKTGIAVLLNTGTVIGAGANVYGAEMPPKFVPPFSWGTGEKLIEYKLDKFLEVTERAMARRDVHLTDSARAQLRAAWKSGRSAWGTAPAG